MCELPTLVILGLFKIMGNSNHLVIETDCMTSETFFQLGNSVTANKSLILISRKWQVSLKSLQPIRLGRCKNNYWVLEGFGTFQWVSLSPVPAVPGVWFLAGQSEKNKNFHLGGIFSSWAWESSPGLLISQQHLLWTMNSTRQVRHCVFPLFEVLTG